MLEEKDVTCAEPPMAAYEVAAGQTYAACHEAFRIAERPVCDDMLDDLDRALAAAVKLAARTRAVYST